MASEYDAEAEAVALVGHVGAVRYGSLVTIGAALRAAHEAGRVEGEAGAEAAKLRAVVDAARGLLHDSQRGQHPPGFKGMKAGPPRLPPSLASLVRRWLAEPIAALDAAGEVE
ncbi:MAG: hypothetical protein DRQ64_00390 [Gammaproteobacteria bacterium]|nr:MAG: hypothetical protein DRQ64_00390 [Gammaproteobacteria bacterium]